MAGIYFGSNFRGRGIVIDNVEMHGDGNVVEFADGAMVENFSATEIRQFSQAVSNKKLEHELVAELFEMRRMNLSKESAISKLEKKLQFTANSATIISTLSEMWDKLKF